MGRVSSVRTQAPLGGGNEGKEGFRCRTAKLFLRGGQPSAELAGTPEETVVELLQLESFLRADPSTPETHDVQSAESVVAPRDSERRKVLADPRAALHQGQRPDSYKLMNQAVPGKEGTVVHRDMAREERSVGDDDLVSQDHVVP